MSRVKGAQIYSADILEELKRAMEEDDRLDEDDESAFRLKINALQRFLNHGMSRFSIETWYSTLNALFQAYCQTGHDNGDHILQKITTVSHLRLLLRAVIMHRDGGSIGEADTHSLKYVENFLSALQCLKESKASMDTIYSFLFCHYYSPETERLREESLLLSENEKPSTHDYSSGKTSKVRNTPRLQHSQGARDHPGDSVPSQYGILTSEQMTGSTAHRLRLTVQDMREILSRWDRLKEGEEIQMEDMDPESEQDLLMLQGKSTFEPILRLLPDIFSKYYKCLELAKQWWVLAHQIYPELPFPSPVSQDNTLTDLDSEDEGRSDISGPTYPALNQNKDDVPLTEKLLETESDIQNTKLLLRDMQEELHLLEERELHFESLVEAYEKVTAQLESKVRERTEVVTAVEVEPASQTSRPEMSPLEVNSHVKDGRKSTSISDRRIENVDREIRLLQFQQALLLQDYLLQLEIRPCLIRFTEDLKIRSREAEEHLKERKDEHSRLEILIQKTSEAPKKENEQNSPKDYKEPHSPECKFEVTADQRKLELSRLRARSVREDTTEENQDLNSGLFLSSAVEPTRMQSSPARGSAASPLSNPNVDNFTSKMPQNLTQSVPSAGHKLKLNSTDVTAISNSKLGANSQGDAKESANKAVPLFQRRALKKELQKNSPVQKLSISVKTELETQRPRTKSESNVYNTLTNESSSGVLQRHNTEDFVHPDTIGRDKNSMTTKTKLPIKSIANHQTESKTKRHSVHQKAKSSYTDN